jgi:hypothetical protein
MYLKLLSTTYLHLYLPGLHVRQYRVVHLVQVRLLFLSSLITVGGLTCHTRAVSRIPLAFMAISTICSLICGDWPG